MTTNSEHLTDNQKVTRLIRDSGCTIRAMEREVRYCTTKDGVRIAYCVEGEGPPLVIAPYLLESLSLHKLYPSFADFMREARPGIPQSAMTPEGRGSRRGC